MRLTEQQAACIHETGNLRNRLVHEYMHEAEEFAAALNRAGELVPLLVKTYDTLRGYVQEHFPGR